MESCKYMYHTLTIVLLFVILFIFFSASGAIGQNKTNNMDPYSEYGKWPTIIMYVMRLLTLVPLPLSVFNFLGIIMYNTFPEKPTRRTSLFGPYLCFRVVTKGTFPELVKQNLERNINICTKLGVDRFIFEVVTDNAIHIRKSGITREIIVPPTYSSSKGSMYKARALQYCLEEGVHMLADNDWIVHLDEETILTESSVIGILNFIHDGKASFGQGVITYANEEIICWITTIADLIRVGVDYGALRFSMNFLKKPLFSWKGSYVVSNAGAERKVTFDFGPEGSIAEDCFFGLTAWKMGYKFGFIEGEMWEKSPFSALDYIKQRRRWIQGITMTFLSNALPLPKKFGISFMILGWVLMPVTVPNVILVPLYPLPMPQVINFLCGFMGGMMMFLFIFGAIKSFNYRRMGVCKFVLVCLSPIALIPVCIAMETCGVLLALCTRKSAGFHIVRKEVHTTKDRSAIESPLINV